MKKLKLLQRPANKDILKGICLSGWAAVLALFYPGSMSVDSVNQLEQAIEGRYTDWHPPLMAALWRLICQPFEARPEPMLILQLTVLWLGLYLLGRALLPYRPRLALFAPLIGILPPLVGIEGVIWKDIGLGASFCLGSMLVIDGYLRKSGKLQLSVATVLLFYGTAVRYNSLLALLPIAALFVHLVLRERERYAQWCSNWRVLTTGSLVVAVTFLLLNQVIVYGVLKSTRAYTVQYIFLHDLNALSAQKNEILFPAAFRIPEKCSLDGIRKAAQDPRCGDSILYGAQAPAQQTTDPKQISVLKQTWFKAIRQEPMLYLEHRWRLFKSLLNIGFGSCRITHFGTAPNRFSYSVDVAPFQMSLSKLFASLYNSTPLYKGWLWGLLACAGLGASLERRRRQPVERKVLNCAALFFSSALLYLFPYFAVGVCCDFRYLWWTILATLMGLLFLFSIPLTSKKAAIKDPE